MGFEKNVGGRSRLVRALLAVGLAVTAVRALRSGKRKTGLLAGVGALGIGFTATTRYRDETGTSDRDTTAAEVAATDGRDGIGSATDTASEPGDEPPTRSTGRRSSGRGTLTCASCGEPIRLGQRRGPNDRDEIVHDECP